MRRRAFITLLGGAAAVWPLAVRTQQAGPMRRIGVLMSLEANDPEGNAQLTRAFRIRLSHQLFREFPDLVDVAAG
jgi:putative ABC transport system substrate-binding protein